MLVGVWDDADNSPVIRPSPPALRACVCASVQMQDLHVENWKNALVFTGPRVATPNFNSITRLSLTKFKDNPKV